ncbi:cellulase-like family protein [Streptomyces sp. SS52]|uniref:cellulase-like family protein n=1 Tax=Streptomyces sp. SS52 TaxID=2563602 RepID=UPI001FF9BC4E|nr:cellulase-like family protein [Streptomyces sp. SS52]
MPVAPPAHLPDTLTICLWDFSWYTRTGPGEPFADLDEAFAQTVARGYNTVRVCAMPLLLFGPGSPRGPLTLGPWAAVRPGRALVRRARPTTTLPDPRPTCWRCSRPPAATTCTSSSPAGSTSRAPPSPVTGRGSTPSWPSTPRTGPKHSPTPWPT